MKVSDPSAPFNPNPSGLSEIHACAVHVQILTEFKCQVRMTAPDLRAQVCPLPLLVDAETQFRGRKSVCKSFDNRTPAVWFSLFRDLALNSHMTQKQLLVWAGWAVCLADYPYAQHERARKLLGNAGASRKQPALLFITSHFYFSHRDTQQFTPRESSKFSSSLWAAIGCMVPTWQNPIGWQRARDVSFEKADRGSKQACRR